MQRLLGGASPKLASGVYIDRTGVKREAARWISQDHPSSTMFGARAERARLVELADQYGRGTRTPQALSSTGNERRRVPISPGPRA
jgi:hypothetical protein